MVSLMPQEAPMPGFNFENCKRNAMLAAQGFKPPKVIFFGTLFLELLKIQIRN